MISVHLDGLRRADVTHDATGACVTLRVGAFDRVTIMVTSSTQARIIAEAINAGLADPHAPILTERPGGA